MLIAGANLVLTDMHPQPSKALVDAAQAITLEEFPRFVEDCVREALRGAIERFGGLRDDAFVSARQENLETIHQHNVVAERFGLLGELRHELESGEHLAHHTSMREWLDAAGR